MTPAVIASSLDSSWKVTLNYAFRERLAFGQDVIFTYGPLSFLNTNMFHPAHYGFVFVYQMLLAFVFAAISVVVLNVKRNVFVKLILYLAMIVIAIFAGAVSDNLNLALPVLLVIVVGIQKLDTNNRALLNVIVLLLLILMSLALLAKGSSLLIVIPVLLMLDFLRILERKFPIYVGAVALLVMISWTVIGQPISALLPYFITLVDVIRGYSEMAMDGPIERVYTILLCALSLAIASAALVFTHYRHTLDAKGTKSGVTVQYLVVALLSVALVVFLSFKSGFVRHDAHEILAFFGIFIASLFFAIIYFSFLKLRLLSMIPVLVSVGICIFVYGQYMQETYYKNRNYFLLSVENAFNTKPTESFKFIRRANAARANPEPFLVSLLGEAYDLEKRYAQISGEVMLPEYLRDKTVDIFPWDQALLIAKELNYSPRPVIQSYSVYTESLIRKNIDYYLSDDAPDYIVFAVKTIDDRYPSIDDGALWPVIWSRYEAVELTDGFLILKRRQTDTVATITKEDLESYELNLGEDLSVEAINSDLLWLKGEVSKNWLGKIVGLLYKVPILRVVIEFDDGSSQTYRILPSILQSGFLLSPYVASASDFALSQISDTSSLKNVERIQFIDTPHMRRFYKHKVNLTIEQVVLDQDNKFLSDQLKEHMMFTQLVNSNAFTVSSALSKGKQWNRNWLADRTVLFAHADTRAELNLEMLKQLSYEHNNKLNIEYGIAEGAYSGKAKTNGVIFNVIGIKEDGEQDIFFSDTLDPLNDVLDRGLHKHGIDAQLEDYKTVVFETLANGNKDWDWSYWSNISLP